MADRSGPRVTARWIMVEKVLPIEFARALRNSASASGSSTAFASLEKVREPWTGLSSEPDLLAQVLPGR